MVFSSVPAVYLDPPNWNQGQVNQEGSTSTSNNNPGAIQAHGMALSRAESNSPLQIRPNSMAEKARMAKIPQPETCLKCPRCESTNTKFCYFNNYSLTQPRHFCKTCRRYWTRGGALRNVPVGGGCRRNKRSKSSSSNSSSKSSSINNTTAAAAAAPSSSSSTSASTSAIHAATAANLNHQLPNFMAALHPLEYGVQFTGMQGIDNSSVGFQDGGLEQWRIHQQIQQFPFLGGMEPQQGQAQAQAQAQAQSSSSSLFPFDHGEEAGMPYKVVVSSSASGLISQFASVKMDDRHNSHRFSNIPRQFIGSASRTSDHHDQYWNSNISGGGGNTGTGNGGWITDISGNLL